MAKINLLPWRAERRERRKREFFTHLGIAAVAAIVLVLLWGFWMSLRIQNQDNRNDYLNAQIKQQQAKIDEIKNLQKVKDHLLARKRIVEKLQSSRSQMVHLFDQIVATIPSGARLTSLKEVEHGDTETLTLNGVAQSNATVAEYMRNIEASPWMGPATLVRTVNAHTDSNTPYEFELVVTLGIPKDDNSGKPAPAASATAPASTALADASAMAPAAPPASAPASANPAQLPAALPSASATTSAPAASASGSAKPMQAAQTAPASGSAEPVKAATTPAASTTKGGAGS